MNFNAGGMDFHSGYSVASIRSAFQAVSLLIYNINSSTDENKLPLFVSFGCWTWDIERVLSVISTSSIFFCRAICTSIIRFLKVLARLLKVNVVLLMNKHFIRHHILLFDDDKRDSLVLWFSIFTKNLLRTRPSILVHSIIFISPTRLIMQNLFKFHSLLIRDSQTICDFQN